MGFTVEQDMALERYANLSGLCPSDSTLPAVLPSASGSATVCDAQEQESKALLFS